MGVQLSWESTCFASRGSSVRSRLSPPRDKGTESSKGNPLREKWAYSSAGQSVRLISGRSMVRVHLSPPFFAFNCVGVACKYLCMCCASRLVKNKKPCFMVCVWRSPSRRTKKLLFYWVGVKESENAAPCFSPDEKITFLFQRRLNNDFR